MPKNPLLGKHSHNNRESREGEIFKHIREAKKLTLQEAAALMNMKTIDVYHFENGRKFFKEEDVNKFLASYKFSQDDFKQIMGFKILNRQMINHFISKISTQQ